MTVVARTTRDVVTVTGPDAATYLQGQLSQDVNRLAPGESAATFVLAPQGKVDGWGRVTRIDGETFEIDSDPGAGTNWEARLRRFLLRTKAEVSLRTDVPTLAVRGGVVPGGRPAGWPGVVGSDLLGIGVDEQPSDLPADATEVDEAALEGLRIAAGVPRWGRELDEDTIPATVGQWAIDASVSFTTGCYTGQELVARIDSRGGNVPRRLAVATVADGAVADGAEVAVAGETIGTVTSAGIHEGTGVALVFVPRAVELPAEATVGGRPATLAAAGA